MTEVHISNNEFREQLIAADAVEPDFNTWSKRLRSTPDADLSAFAAQEPQFSLRFQDTKEVDGFGHWYEKKHMATFLELGVPIQCLRRAHMRFSTDFKNGTLQSGGGIETVVVGEDEQLQALEITDPKLFVEQVLGMHRLGNFSVRALLIVGRIQRDQVREAQAKQLDKQ